MDKISGSWMEGAGALEKGFIIAPALAIGIEEKVLVRGGEQIVISTDDV